jgi:hypothetical protein
MFVFIRSLSDRKTFTLGLWRLGNILESDFRWISQYKSLLLHTVMGESPSSFFAALVSLPSISSLPQGHPFADGEVVYSTVFDLSWDYLAPRDLPFDVTINPGAYAIIFGAGRFGSLVHQQVNYVT